MSRLALATNVVVSIPGVPPNWSNERLHHMAKAREVKRWRELAWYAAQSARNAAHWPLPEKTNPPAPRYLRIVLLKRKPHYDDDGAWNAVKPLIDGCQGVLLVNDSPAWCQVVDVQQKHPVLNATPESTVIWVYLVDPRNVGPADGH